MCFGATLSIWPTLFCPLCPQACSLWLPLHCCPTDRFISTIFLDSIYIYINIWYLSCSFCTSSCIIGSRSVKWLHSWSSSIRLLITKILEHWQGILFLLSSIISPVPFLFVSFSSYPVFFFFYFSFPGPPQTSKAEYSH